MRCDQSVPVMALFWTQDWALVHLHPSGGQKQSKQARSAGSQLLSPGRGPAHAQSTGCCLPGEAGFGLQCHLHVNDCNQMTSLVVARRRISCCLHVLICDADKQYFCCRGCTVQRRLSCARPP